MHVQLGLAKNTNVRVVWQTNRFLKWPPQTFVKKKVEILSCCLGLSKGNRQTATTEMCVCVCKTFMSGCTTRQRQTEGGKKEDPVECWYRSFKMFILNSPPLTLLLLLLLQPLPPCFLLLWRKKLVVAIFCRWERRMGLRKGERGEGRDKCGFNLFMITVLSTFLRKKSGWGNRNTFPDPQLSARTDSKQILYPVPCFTC